MDPALQTLLQRTDIWRAKAGVTTLAARPALATGFAGLDRALHGGWPSAALTEIVLAQTGVGELGLLMPLLKDRAAGDPRQAEPHRPGSAGPAKRIKRFKQLGLDNSIEAIDQVGVNHTAPINRVGPINRVWPINHLGPINHIWIDPPLLPYAPALLQHGIKLDNLLIVYPADRAQWLWACVQALRSGSRNAVLCWSNNYRLRYADVRQLQVTASAHGSLGFLLRDLTQDRRILQHSTPAPLRLRLQTQHGALTIDVLKQRGHSSGQQIVLPHNAALQAQTPLRKRNVIVSKIPTPRAAQLTVAITRDEARWL